MIRYTEDEKFSRDIKKALDDEEMRLGLTQACYRQIERLNPTLNAFITVIPPERSAEGAQRAARRSRAKFIRSC